MTKENRRKRLILMLEKIRIEKLGEDWQYQRALEELEIKVIEELKKLSMV